MRSKGENEKAEKVAQSIDSHYRTPIQGLNESQEKCDACETERRERFTFKWISRQSNVDSADTERRANAWRFIGLLGLIGNTETGLYPNLNSDKEKIEETIIAYMEKLAIFKW